MKKGNMIIVVMAGMLLSGCGSNHLEEGVSFLEEGQYEEAVEVFQKEVEANENLGEAYRGIGIAYFEMEEFENAVNAFEDALKSGAEESAALCNMKGISYMKLGDYEEAAAAFENGIAIEDSSEELRQEMLFNTVVSYEKMGDWESAKAKLNEYLAEVPDDEKALKEAEFLETR